MSQKTDTSSGDPRSRSNTGSGKKPTWRLCLLVVALVCLVGTTKHHGQKSGATLKEVKEPRRIRQDEIVSRLVASPVRVGLRPVLLFRDKTWIGVGTEVSGKEIITSAHFFTKGKNGTYAVQRLVPRETTFRTIGDLECKKDEDFASLMYTPEELITGDWSTQYFGRHAPGSREGILLKQPIKFRSVLTGETFYVVGQLEGSWITNMPRKMGYSGEGAVSQKMPNALLVYTGNGPIPEEDRQLFRKKFPDVEFGDQAGFWAPIPYQ
jgi:hypothetical protein